MNSTQIPPRFYGKKVLELRIKQYIHSTKFQSDEQFELKSLV